MHYDVLIVGGGAAGFFTTINIAENNSNLKIAILEKSKEGLQKVKVSGGGRCNVTHAEFVPTELVKNYPRGEKELLGPFHKFMTGDTIQWFQDKGIELKIEEDGRMFPISDSSQTIINCFIDAAQTNNIEILYSHVVKDIICTDEVWKLITNQGDLYCNQLVLATGSSAKMWGVLKKLGHSIVDPVPSLFTFNISDQRIKDIPGVVIDDVDIKVLVNDEYLDAHIPELISEGPLLITHWGMSAPAILKLSAFGAVILSRYDYRFSIEINFLKLSFEECLERLKELKLLIPKQKVYNNAQFDLPKRFWKQIVLAANLKDDKTWADLDKEGIHALAKQLTQAVFKVDGKSTFKEEFVTAGGIDLKEVDFRRYESKLYKNLFFAGEILNIDAVTGGFNFQNAWTGGFIVAEAISNK